MISLYLRSDLYKGDPAKPKVSHKGEQKGGKYVARAQVGTNNDGSPKYRYFSTEKEYETYLEGRGRTPSQHAKDRELETKVKEEQKDSKKDTTEGPIKHQPASRSHSLLKEDKAKEEKTEKSLSLFLRIG
jgi:hypothetical protein